MAAGDYRMGLNGVFKYGTAGSTAATTTTNISTVEIALSARVAEAVRRNKTWVAKKPYVLEATLTFTIWDVVGDAFMAALETAYTTKAKIALYPTTEQSGKGLDGDYYITNFSRSEDNEGFVTYSVEAVPTDETRDPSWA